MNKLTRLAPSTALLTAVLLLASGTAMAQSFCSSDGRPQPVALLERFINADCEACWADAATPQAARGELALDWIVPGGRGDDAPLSAAASRDSGARLEALGRARPATTDYSRSKIQPAPQRLRVSHGLPFNGYLGTSIELKPGSGRPWRAWLALVETIPAGVEGTPVERNLVRNVLQPSWGGAGPLSKEEQRRLYEARPLSIPEGANPDRLRVVGWVEDSQGRIRAIAQSRCAQSAGRG
jgi:hypothetical protein